jgi:hypothetical protein
MGISRRARGFIIAGVVTGAYAAATAAAVRRGYAFGRNTTVRCRAGHLFTTVWIPGASVKALKLGPWRLQWCPVGRHVALVHPVRDADLADADRELAAGHHDIPLP